MKIRTDQHYKIPTDYAWSAIDDDTYDGAKDSATRNMVGYGATEEEAIADLQRLIRERDEDEEDRRSMGECSCRSSNVHSTDIDPPYQIRDRRCPVHGDGGPDPDDLRDNRMER